MATDLVAGDTTTLKVTCLDKGSREIIPDLDQAAGVQLKYRIGDGELQTREMTVVDSDAGLVSYRFVPEELQAGMLRGEVTIIDAGNNPLTNLEPVVLTVRKAV